MVCFAMLDMTGFNRKVWFKEEDIALYIASKFPMHREEVIDEFHRLGMAIDIKRYAPTEQLFEILARRYAVLGSLYHRVAEGEQVYDEIIMNENKVQVLREILFMDIPGWHGVRNGFRFEYEDELLSHYKDLAKENKRFDNETIDILKKR